MNLFHYKDQDFHSGLLKAFIENIPTNGRPLIFLCIGSDRFIGDSPGPLMGYYLKKMKPIDRLNQLVHVYGTISHPVHALNLQETLDEINTKFLNPYIVAMDASLANFDGLGIVEVNIGPIHPGIAFNKKLPSVGDLSVVIYVGKRSNDPMKDIQNVRLGPIITITEKLADVIFHYLEEYHLFRY
jgi:putative sporulation protein YyaC